ncbi:hypothetical protein NDU88_002583 [Pleurodeles waltl]|uniref:Uncharacterized protein n=1 Tax=Pleurodeles waltl TaxID=8319 RepID=A0AAV7L3X8_PLEWA|nr:hypothetical protein NDU88_002583 [Pleurodeles waltl]
MPEPGYCEVQTVANGANAPVSSRDSAQLPTVETNRGIQAAHILMDTSPALCSKDVMEGISDSNLLHVEARKIGRRKKVPDWSRDGGDKFYLLIEDSEASSSGCNQCVGGGSTPSETESASSAEGSTVRPQRRHHQCLKTRSGSMGAVEPSLKWDYSGTRLMGLEKVSKLDPPPNIDGDVECPASSNSATGIDAKMLQMIYDTIRELQTETRAESRRARIATKYLQGEVCKVVRSCIEIEEKLRAMENRTAVVEADIEALKEQTETHAGQLTDIMWKLEDFEKRQRRNNLHFWGVEEGADESLDPVVRHRKTSLRPVSDRNGHETNAGSQKPKHF